MLHDVFADAVRRDRRDCGQARRHLPSTRPTRARQVRRRARPELTDVADAEHQLVTEKFITACANGDLEALTAVLDPAVWGVGTVVGEGLRRRRSITVRMPSAATCFAISEWRNACRRTGRRAVLLAFAGRRLFAVIVLTMRDNLVFKIEASVDPTAAARP